MYIPRRRIFWAVAFAHLANDIFMAIGPFLLSFINGLYLTMNPATIGIAIGVQQFIGAVAQPLFGWQSDKGNNRWLGAGGLAWTVSFLCVSMLAAMLTGNFWLMMIPYAVAALGSAAFHPVGTSYASFKSDGRATTDTAYFFLMGQMGLSLGPLLGGVLLGLTQVNGQGGSVYPVFILALFALPIVFFLATSLPRRVAADRTTPAPESVVSTAPTLSLPLRALLLLALMVFLRSIATPGSAGFLPTLYKARGWDPQSYGAITAAYWVASALAGVFVGGLADRFERRYVVSFSLLLAIPAYYLMPVAEGGLAFLVVMLTGALVGGSHSIIVVMVQSLLPGRKAFASGVALGMIFGLGALGTMLMGAVASGFTLGGWVFGGIGLESAFRNIGWALLGAGLLALLIPKQPQATPPAVTLPQPAADPN